MVVSSVSEMDRINQTVWQHDAGLFAIEGWSDPGELEAFMFVADLARGGPILDLGVGGGRTASLLRLLSAQYVAIDYTPAMVDLCRRRHPGLDVRHGDARDLDGIADASQQLVLFSVNGIDAVDHDGRQQVLAAVRRVLRPGGLFLFSTLNKDGALFGAHPGSAPALEWEPGSLLPRRPDAPMRPVAAPDTGAAAPTGDDGEEAPPEWAIAVDNWRRLRRQTVDSGDWGVAPFAAHHFALLTHFITMAGERAELDRHGMDVEAVFSCDGELVTGQASTAMYLHFVARRR
ncbi:MAG TPA: class I SAM-dependent methyltransferase [Acidimicrobiales bacterium]|nr:class I SAM-dependent methyltransferase [Acidimicrobiales bacterium]